MVQELWNISVFESPAGCSTAKEKRKTESRCQLSLLESIFFATVHSLNNHKLCMKGLFR